MLEFSSIVIFFVQQLHSFLFDIAKIMCIVGLLRAGALTWVQSLSSQSLDSFSFNKFKYSFMDVFDHPNHVGNTTDQLLESY